MPNATAPKGKVYVCLACGKMSQDKYGPSKISLGWDVSCMLNSQLFNRADCIIGENGRVAKIKEQGPAPGSKVP